MVIITLNALNILFSPHELGFLSICLHYEDSHFMIMFPSIARLINLVLMVIFMTIIFDEKLSIFHIFVMIDQTIS